MHLSPLAITILLALLTGVAAIAVWALLAGHFYPLGASVGQVKLQ
jgi:hypothetical protein